MIKIFFIIFFVFHSLPNYSQNFNHSPNNFVVRDTIGSVQTRSVNTYQWMPVTAGVAISAQSFIRLNSPNSILTLSFPDGSQLRLIGIGSFFIDTISKVVNNIYQNKLLVLSGRWFYNSDSSYQSRIVVNTDITTSIIENGAGGGFFYQGTNEFLLQHGRGITSYRQTNTKGIVLDQRQVVNFNIYDGFFHPTLATEKVFEKYLIFETNSTTNKATAKDLESLNLSTYNSKIFFIGHELQKKDLTKRPLSEKEIDINQLDILKDLSFKIREDLSQVTIFQEESVEPEMFTPLQPPPRIIPKQLLEEIDIRDFQIISNIQVPPIPEPKKEVQKKPPPSQQRRPKRISKKPTPPIVPILPTEPIPTIEPDIDLEQILDQIDENASQEKENQEKEKRGRKPPRLRKPKIVIEKKPPIPVVEEFLGEISLEEPIIEVPEEPIIADEFLGETSLEEPLVEEPPVEEEESNYDGGVYYDESHYEDLTEEEKRTLYEAGKNYYNRNLQDDVYQYNQFQLENIDDLLDSDFTSVLLQL